MFMRNVLCPRSFWRVVLDELESSLASRLPGQMREFLDARNSMDPRKFREPKLSISFGNAKITKSETIPGAPREFPGQARIFPGQARAFPELARISPGLENALPEAKSRNFSENTKIDIMHRYLALIQDFAYGFFW